MNNCILVSYLILMLIDYLLHGWINLSEHSFKWYIIYCVSITQADSISTHANYCILRNMCSTHEGNYIKYIFQAITLYV